jgi:hypothetical protein
MTALLEFQRTLARAVMQPLSTRDNMKRGAEDGIALVKPNSRMSSFERLEIYNRSYWSRVLSAFSEDFPGVRALVGAKRFDRLRRSYLADCPSESFTMRDLGKHLATWMERNSSLVGENYGAALEMAKLEWAEIESFDAAEHERLTPADVAALDPASALHLQPHLRLIEAGNEVDRLLLEIREAAKRTQALPRAFSMKRMEAARSAIPLYIAVHRFELVVHYKRLDREMFLLVSALAEGCAIAEAVEAAYSDSTLTPEACQQHIQDSFALFAALGWFCKFNPRKGKEPL